MRIGGLASGMDIDSIIAKMMEAQRAPLNKLQQQKQTYEWQRDAFRTINKNAKTLSDYMFDNMTRQASLIKKNVTSSNDAITATANADATGSLQITKVESLATSATIKAEGIFTTDEGIGVASNTKLVDFDNFKDLFKDGVTSHELKMKVLKDNGKMEDVTINITNEDTVGTMVSKFNASGTGLNAFYDERSGSLSISTKATGVGTVSVGGNANEGNGSTSNQNPTPISLETSMYVESGNSFFNALGFGFNNNGELTADSSKNTGVSQGSNAKLEYNGLTIERQSNTFNLAGYNVTLNKTYTEQAPITLKATTDVDNFINKVEEFVNKYNEFIKSTHGAINETKNRNYAPLTEEQKKEMSEEEIEKWEKVAKSGVIRRDQTVATGLQNLRSIIYSNAGATGKKYDTLSEIGITTTKTYNDGGLLELDKDKLREALLADEEAVFKVFSNDKEGEPKGIIQQMRTSLDNFQSSIEVKAGKESAANNTFTIGRNMDSVDSRIKTWEEKLKMIEERYWNQFTAMEKAISKANEQASLFFSGQAQ